MLIVLSLSGYPNKRLAKGFPWVPSSAPLFGLSEVTSSVKLRSPVGFGGWKKLLKKMRYSPPMVIRCDPFEINSCVE
jgi:hypothetical protein